jgi:hypothetical protein
LRAAATYSTEAASEHVSSVYRCRISARNAALQNVNA